MGFSRKEYWSGVPLLLLFPEVPSSVEMDVSLSELRELVIDREAWRAGIHGVTRVRHDLATELN